MSKYTDLSAYSKLLKHHRYKKEFNIITRESIDFLDNYKQYVSDLDNLTNKQLVNFIDVLNEILIGTWYSKHMDLSKKSAQLIQEYIYGVEINTAELNLIVTNLNYHNIAINILHDRIKLFGGNNYGDATSLFLIEKIFKVKLHTVYINTPKEKEYRNKDNYVTMGSILPAVYNTSYVWGSGYIRNEDKVHEIPKEIRTVRGPLTRAKLITQHIWCPKSFGDPALLLPLVYNPEHEIKFKYGVIPHLWDRNHTLIQQVKDSNDYLYIEIDSGNRPYHLLNQINKCEIIISSSLHGIIIAAAYKKPFIWCKFSDRLYGKNFKFYDFLLSIEQNPIHKWCDSINCNNLNDFSNRIQNKEINIDTNVLHERGKDLITSNPFNNHEKYIQYLLERWNNYCNI